MHSRENRKLRRRDLCALLTASIPTQAAPAARPNILIYLTDDESWLERSAYGWSRLPTPHFDRVAKQGVLFTRGYTSAPSCAPSRATLLTGRHFWELEEGAFIQAWLPTKFPVLPDLMESAGYAAGYTGKGWGPGVLEPAGRKRNPAGDAYQKLRRTTREDAINDIDYAANLDDFLTRKPKDKPFWFWVGVTEPHGPYGRDNHRNLSKYGLSVADVKVPGFLPDTPGVQRERANFAYEVCHADDDLGQVLKVLERHGALENTLLIVTADNGTALPRSKTNLQDWGVHVPMAMMWPARVPPARRVDDFVNFADLAPTILEAAGIPVPRGMSGRSILPILTSKRSGRIDPARGWVAAGLEWHGEFDPVSLAARMIRDERYHYIVNYGGEPRMTLDPTKRLPDTEFEKTAASATLNALLEKHPGHPAVSRFIPLLADPRPREELYDCREDPWQLRNLAGSPPHAAIKARLKNQLETLQRRTRDPRITGEMQIFERTRQYVQQRKRNGYGGE
ncbi:MAG: sulfatase [Bryobacterales bacterium]|nr:sulfatase [Bryobacterales bacterium]